PHTLSNNLPYTTLFRSLLKNVQQVYSLPENPHPITSSFKRVWETITHLRKYKAAAWFLVAYFFYIDGVDTIFTMATSIGMDMGIDRKSTRLNSSHVSIS